MVSINGLAHLDPVTWRRIVSLEPRQESRRKRIAPVLGTFVMFVVDGMLRPPIVRTLVIWLLIGCGFFLGGLLSGWLKITRWVTTPTAILIVLLLVWGVTIVRLLLVIPLPVCRGGTCRTLHDYRWKVGTICGRERWGEYHYQCRCGDRYVRHGRRFMVLSPEGAKHPYKKLIGFRKWIDDSGPVPNDQGASSR